jgi:hypothetical protein
MPAAQVVSCAELRSATKQDREHALHGCMWLCTHVAWPSITAISGRHTHLTRSFRVVATAQQCNQRSMLSGRLHMKSGVPAAHLQVLSKTIVSVLFTLDCV